MERRKFIQQATMGSLLAGSGLVLDSCAPKAKHLTILHTNDVHSHIDPFPAQHAQYPNKGGLARRATLVDQIRQENPNTLLLDAGDIFQGTPYFNFYGGELEFKLMSMLKYDAATIGNHDFDNGVEGLSAQMPHAQFDMICANYDFKNTLMEGQVKPHKVFFVDGIKVGVYGLGISFEGLVTPRLYGETRYLDPIGIAQDTERHLSETEACDLVICLSHLGYSYKGDKVDDCKLAAQTQFTDLIIGGHTHTFLDRPTVLKNQKGWDILVNQVGCFGINLGRIDFYFTADGHVNSQGISIQV